MASKRRPYAHLSDSIWREPWPTRAKLSVYNLIAYLHERWRTDRLDARTMFPLKIGWREAGLIFGGNSRAATLQGVLQVGCCITCSWVATDQHLEWSWPKWLQEQGLIPDERPTNAPPNPNPRTSSSEESDAPTGARREPVKSVRKKEPEPITEEARALTRGFLDSRAAPFPASKPPTPSAYAKWELEMDRLLRIDSRTPDQVIVLTRWLFDPTSRASSDAVFWRANIQSVPKLREKWDQLEACRLRGKSNGKQTVTDAAENVVRRFSAFAAERGR